MSEKEKCAGEGIVFAASLPHLVHIGEAAHLEAEGRSEVRQCEAELTGVLQRTSGASKAPSQTDWRS